MYALHTANRYLLPSSHTSRFSAARTLSPFEASYSAALIGNHVSQLSTGHSNPQFQSTRDSVRQPSSPTSPLTPARMLNTPQNKPLILTLKTIDKARWPVDSCSSHGIRQTTIHHPSASPPTSSVPSELLSMPPWMVLYCIYVAFPIVYMVTVR